MKIRFKTWYYGNWVYSGTMMSGTIVTEISDGFEPYIEEQHGWHNSEEYKNLNLKGRTSVRSALRLDNQVNAGLKKSLRLSE